MLRVDSLYRLPRVLGVCQLNVVNADKEGLQAPVALLFTVILRKKDYDSCKETKFPV